MRTRSRDAIERLFADGDMYITFEDWLIDHPNARFPIEAFRRLELEGD